jgi:hypothetical protein
VLAAVADAAVPAPAWSASLSPGLSYQVTLSRLAGQSRWQAEVVLRLPSGGPLRLTDGEPEWGKNLPSAIALWTGSGGWRSIALSGDGYPVPALPGGGVVRYRLELPGTMGGDLVVHPDVLWLRPERLAPGTPVQVSFPLPADLAGSLPWPPERRLTSPPATLAYQLDGRLLRAGGYLAFGQLRRWRQDIDAGGRPAGRAARHLDIALLSGAHRATPAGLRRYLELPARTVAELYGELPAPRVHVVIEPVDSDEASAFGTVSWGGHPTVRLFLGNRAADAELPRDWVAIHELFHLGQPRMRGKDRWFTEGFATYYQDVLRGRNGAFERPFRMWEDLVWGFWRGQRAAAGSGESLEEASRSMSSFARVYWGGALIALLCDLELREKSGGKRSLDHVLRVLYRRSHAPGADFEMTDVLRVIDEAAGFPVLSGLYRRHVRGRQAFDLDGLYRRLGLRTRGRDLLEIMSGAPWAHHREAIGRAVTVSASSP